MKKTLGQLGYETWAAACGGLTAEGHTLATWERLSPAEKSRWEKTGAAMKAATNIVTASGRGLVFTATLGPWMRGDKSASVDWFTPTGEVGAGIVYSRIAEPHAEAWKWIAYPLGGNGSGDEGFAPTQELAEKAVEERLLGQHAGATTLPKGRALLAELEGVLSKQYDTEETAYHAIEEDRDRVAVALAACLVPGDDAATVRNVRGFIPGLCTWERPKLPPEGEKR